MALLANDLFNKRQRLIEATHSAVNLFDHRSAELLDREYREAESEYLQAKAAFARAMTARNRDD